jgi:hypothetical protein
MLYTSFTDGTVTDDITHARTGSGSGAVHAGPSYDSTTGQAVIVGDDPFALNITQVATFHSSTFPYQGRYPCGQLAFGGNWWYGTYCATIAGRTRDLHSAPAVPPPALD